MLKADSPLVEQVVARGGEPVEDAGRILHFGNADAEYRACVNDTGLADLSGRTRIELRGADRATFLNNYCTNDVRRLEPGQSCEAFLTSIQGRTLGHMLVFAREESLLVETVPGQADRVISHLDKYLIREDVEIRDVSDDVGELALIGPGAAKLISECAGKELPIDEPVGLSAELGDITCWLQRLDGWGMPTVLVLADREDLPRLCSRLLDGGAVSVGDQTVETLRIEAGWPQYGRDFDEANLPQEVARDEEAVSFTKGCYLGQETVARLDALGHVNRMLTMVRFPDEASDSLPPLPISLEADGKPQGKVTSLTYSPRWQAMLGLAMLRVGHHQPGARLQSAAGEVTVVTPAVKQDGGSGA